VLAIVVRAIQFGVDDFIVNVADTDLAVRLTREPGAVEIGDRDYLDRQRRWCATAGRLGEHLRNQKGVSGSVLGFTLTSLVVRLANRTRIDRSKASTQARPRADGCPQVAGDKCI